MKSFLPAILLLFFASSLTAQTWTGAGDGTSWEDAANWNNEIVPGLDSVVVFNSDATVTGLALTAIGQLRIAGKSTVTIDLNLPIGTGNLEEHAIIVNDTCVLNLGTEGGSRNFIINTDPTRHAITLFGGTDGATVNIAPTSIVTVNSALTVINMASLTSEFNNGGTINMSTVLRDGFRISGNMTNSGTINGPALDRDLFNIKAAGTVTNEEGGLIISEQPGDDGIELIEEATFINNGSLNLTSKAEAGSANVPLAVGNATTAGIFVNNGTDVILDGGVGTTARAIFVDSLGEFTNFGSIMIDGGNDGSRLYVEGVAENGMNGVIDLLDGRFNVNTSGAFVNNGLMITTRDGSGGFVSGSAVNNAFFDYANSNSFAGGSMGDITDKGFSLNNNDTRINAMNNCEVDIANTPYAYFLNGEMLGMANDTGAFVFEPQSLELDSVVLTTTLPGVEIKVRNICQDAVLGLFDAVPTAEVLKIYPTLVASGAILNFDLTELGSGEITLSVFNEFGQRMADIQSLAGQQVSRPINDLSTGNYFVRAVTNDGRLFLGRFVVAK